MTCGVDLILTMSESSNELVTVVIPTRNEARKIKTLLDGLITQMYRPMEIIVVDGSSTDGTKEAVMDYAKKYSQNDLTIRLINEEDYGTFRSLPNARNIGILNAHGDYIVLFDADFDLRSDVEAIRKIVNGFRAGYDHVVITYEPNAHTWLEKHEALDDIIHYFEGGKPQHVVCAFRSKLIKNNLFDSTLGFHEDMELLERIKTKPTVIDTEVRRCYPHNLHEKIRQMLWYGRTWRRYYMKTRKNWVKDFIRSNAVLGLTIIAVIIMSMNYVVGIIPLAMALLIIAYRWLRKDYNHTNILRKYRSNLLDRLLWYLFREIVARFVFNIGVLESLLIKNVAIGK